MLELLNAIAKLDRLEALIVLEECATPSGVLEMDHLCLVETSDGGRALVDNEHQLLYTLHERGDDLSFQRGMAAYELLNDTFALLGTGKAGRGLAEGDWIGAEQLSDRTAAVDQAFVLLRQCRDIASTPAEAINLAAEVLDLSQRWRVIRGRMFDASQRAWTSRQAEASTEEQEQGLIRDLNAFNQRCNDDDLPLRIALDSDPRGSAVTVHIAGDSPRTTGLMGLGMAWRPHEPTQATDAAKRRGKKAGPQEAAPTSTKVPDDVAEVLRAAVCEGTALRIAGTLDRKLYARVDSILKGMGAKWISKQGAHVFQVEATSVVAQALGCGEITTDRDWEFFATPPDIVAKMLAKVDLRPGMKVLEPQGGAGAIAVEAAKVVGMENVHCFELMPRNAETLAKLGFQVEQVDFLSKAPVRRYDCLLLNPPFANLADTLHIEHAAKWLKPGAELVAISSTAWQTRSTTRAKEFRAWLAGLNAEIEDLPSGAFRESGTDVSTLMITLKMPRSVEQPKRTQRPAAAEQQADLFSDVAV